MGKIYIADTNIFMSLNNLEKLIEYCGGLLKVPIYVIEELDNLKTKEGDRGFKARRALRNIKKVEDRLIYVLSDGQSWLLPAEWAGDKMDNRIINCAAYLKFAEHEDIVMLSNDLNVRIKCNSLKIPTEPYHEEEKQTSPGWVEAKMTDEEYDEFLLKRNNLWSLELNEYLIALDKAGELRGIFKYLDDKDWIEVNNKEKIGNVFLGTISPRDSFQACAIDSLLNENFTVITGAAGSGKTLLSLTYALREIRSGARSRLIIFTNPVKTRGSEQLGFYTGDRTEKLLQNSIGAMLSSKIGDSSVLDQLMDENLLEILPMSDIRGYEVGADQIMYITEAQNLSSDLIKLAIQRCAEGSKIILEGDPNTQVDNYAFEGSNNGLKRVIDVFRGYYDFSQVQLPNIYRSKIADKAEEI